MWIKIVIGVITSITAAGLIWFVPYEVDHHTVTNKAAIQVQQLQSDFDEYRMYQEWQVLKNKSRMVKLTQYEQNRLDYLTKVLNAIMEKRYKK